MRCFRSCWLRDTTGSTSQITSTGFGNNGRNRFPHRGEHFAFVALLGRHVAVVRQLSSWSISVWSCEQRWQRRFRNDRGTTSVFYNEYFFSHRGYLYLKPSLTEKLNCDRMSQQVRCCFVARGTADLFCCISCRTLPVKSYGSAKFSWVEIPTCGNCLFVFSEKIYVFGLRELRALGFFHVKLLELHKLRKLSQPEYIDWR